MLSDRVRECVREYELAVAVGLQVPGVKELAVGVRDVCVSVALWVRVDAEAEAETVAPDRVRLPRPVRVAVRVAVRVQVWVGVRVAGDAVRFAVMVELCVAVPEDVSSGVGGVCVAVQVDRVGEALVLMDAVRLKEEV